VTDLIPHAVLSDELEGRLNGRRVVAGVFLTFEFDPGFFEQEILPILLDVPVSHSRGIRLVQLEEALRTCAGRLAVYYDADRLVCGDAGSARLDVARIPMRTKTGVFHPKNVLLLIEEPEPDKEGRKPRSLLVGSLSANLTRSGWWENIEACHFEEIADDEVTRLKEDLADLLKDLRRDAPQGMNHDAVEELRAFLRHTGQRVKRVSGDWLLPHFYSGRESIPEFLERVAGNRIRGSYLEIISPYVDDAPSSKPLEDLIAWFQPKEVRVLLPRARDGKAACRPELYESVRRLPNVHWGRLPSAFSRWGKANGDEQRFVHAKLYRFFMQKPKQEICLVGSVNLTTAAHQYNGNWETGFLVEVDCPRAPDFWLTLEEARPKDFSHQDETEPAKSGGTPLMLRYHWDHNIAEAFWDTKERSPVLTLKARNVERGKLGPLAPRRWHKLDSAWATTLSEMLRRETSFVDVYGYTERPGLLLVQEEGMSHKPSELFQLTVAEILRYWAMLTPAQRAAFLEVKAPDVADAADSVEHLTRLKISLDGETFFDRFAGYFHSFNCLERDVRESLSSGREKQANYRLFGRKYDSLGTLLNRILADDVLTDDVNRYVILLCARQLCAELRRDYPEYWKSRREDVQRLEDDLSGCADFRGRLAAKDSEMPGFLDWFDQWFLKRGRPTEASP
jgi:hypothetical protein